MGVAMATSSLTIKFKFAHLGGQIATSYIEFRNCSICFTADEVAIGSKVVRCTEVLIFMALS